MIQEKIPNNPGEVQVVQEKIPNDPGKVQVVQEKISEVPGVQAIKVEKEADTPTTVQGALTPIPVQGVQGADTSTLQVVQVKHGLACFGAHVTFTFRLVRDPYHLCFVPGGQSLDVFLHIP